MSRGVDEARKLLKAEKRKPTDADRPPPGTFSGREIKVLEGQLALGQEIDEKDDVREETAAA